MHGLRSTIICLTALLLSVGAWGQASQTIRMYPVATQTLGNAPFQVIALASSGLPVVLTVSGPATIYRRFVTPTGPGTVTIQATQAGNGSYAPASAQESFTVNPSPTTVTWEAPASIVYGTPVSASMLAASATAVPVVNAAADVATVTSQLNTSALTGQFDPIVPATSPLLRYNGSTMVASTSTNDNNGFVSNGAAPPNGVAYRVSFTCDCQQFEWAMQSRQSDYRLWVDGQWTTLDIVPQVNHYPARAFYLVQFPDKRPRQILLYLDGNPPFYGVNTTGTDSISAPQTPVGKRTIIMGDSWTGPTISPPLLPPAQDGLNGSGFAQVVGEFFNWDYWISPSGGEGFTNGGTTHVPYGVRALTDICPFSPDMAIVVGGVNDGDITAAEEEQGVLTLANNVAGCLPGMPLYIFGPQQVEPVVSEGLQDAVPLLPSTSSYWDMSPDPTSSSPADWIYGPYADATSGNTYEYIGTTNGAEGHPTPLGHDYVAERIEDALLTKYPSLIPSAYTLFAPAPEAGTFTYSAQAGAILPAGQQTLTASFTPSDAVNYASASQQVTLTILKASTTIQLKVQPGPNGVALQVLVAPQIGGTPTGTVTFTAGTTALGSAQLAGNGQATLLLTQTLDPTASITAQYNGDQNFTGGTATVLLNTPDFSFQVQASQLTIKSGQTGTVNLVVTPVNGLQSGLTLSCTGLPQYASCGSTSATISGSGAVTIPVTISTTGATTIAAARSEKLGGIAIGSALLLLPFGLRRKAWLRILGTASCLAIVCLLSGCASGQTNAAPGAPAVATGVYTVTLTLTTTGTTVVQHSQTLQLTVD